MITLQRQSGDDQFTFNPYYYEYYQQRLAAGKTKTQAIICIMRKLVDLVYALMKNKTEYNMPVVLKQAG